jgi:hypothetical protein
MQFVRSDFVDCAQALVNVFLWEVIVPKKEHDCYGSNAAGRKQPVSQGDQIKFTY